MNNSISVEDAVEDDSLVVSALDSVADNSIQKPATEKTKQTFFSVVRHYATLSDVLRLGGALAVALAMGVYLLEGIEVINDIHRFLTMLGLTAALTAAGLMMSLLLKDQRGSRVFIGLGLLSVPVNFTVFGALLYSVISLDASHTHYPEFAHWQISSAKEIAIALCTGLAVIAPVVWLGFSVLARSARSSLSIMLLLSCAVLVVPVRQELWAALLALISVVILCWQYQRFSKNTLVFKTAEGRFAIALLFVAPMLVVVRSLFLYDVSGILVLTLATAIYITIRQLISQRTDSTLFTGLLTIVAAISVLLLAASAGEVANHYGLNNWAWILAPVLVLLFTLDLKTVSPATAVVNRVCFVLFTIGTCSLVLVSLLSSSALITVVSAGVVIATAIYGYLNKYRIVTAMAVAGAALIAMMNVEELWTNVAQAGWWGIAVGGAVAIVAGSLLDRAGTVVAVSSRTE